MQFSCQAAVSDPRKYLPHLSSEAVKQRSNVADLLWLVEGYDSFTPGLNNWILKLVDFTKSILQDQSRVRIMAVCFGHQIVGRAFGVLPKRSDAGWEVSVTHVALTERGKQVFGQDSLVCMKQRLPKSCTVLMIAS
jgi:GMP synthase-like glutamine amidotransferase